MSNHRDKGAGKKKSKWLVECLCFKTERTEMLVMHWRACDRWCSCRKGSHDNPLQRIGNHTVRQVESVRAMPCNPKLDYATQ